MKMNFKNARHGLVSNRVGYFVYRYAKLIQILPVLNNGTFVRKTLDKIGILWYNIRSKDLKDNLLRLTPHPCVPHGLRYITFRKNAPSQQAFLLML